MSLQSRSGWTLVLVAAAACGDSASRPGDVAPAIAPRTTDRTLTLITGDRVIVAPDGNVRMEPGAGRAQIGFIGSRDGDETIVIPRDVAELVASGRLDPALFNVTRLIAEGFDDAQHTDLPLVITGSFDVAGARLHSSSLSVERVIPAARAVAVRQRKGATSTLLADLAREPSQKIWLDRRYHLSLHRSAAQIGAPAAHTASYTGAGVVVAVLDTGVEAEHPDLVGKVADAITFVDDGQGASDVHGHGTHVASIVAGTGAASEGRIRGVAPDATLVSARICNRLFCELSAILAGMEWAVVTKGAKIVNLSFGGQDVPGVDILEETVNRLSAEHGTLFVAAAGNRGGAGTVESPGTADAALTVGAIDHDEQLAAFSSRGPRVGDGAIKPEITAPGAGIVAARATIAVPEMGEPIGTSYVRANGTSMATPHVAGAAALLLQQHPDWTGAQLKAALTSSADPNPARTPFEQAAGRVDIARAIRQDVTGAPASLGFGVARWPHDDDPVLRGTVTYSNSGSAPLTLSISGTLAHQGVPVAGMLSISASTITVPAGGTAEVVAAIDTNGDRPDGDYAGSLVATAGDLRLVTPIAVQREVATSELTIEVVDHEGNPAQSIVVLGGADDPFVIAPATVRLPHQFYLLMTSISGADGEATVAFPRFELTQPTTVVMDGREATLVDIAVDGRSLSATEMTAICLDAAHRQAVFAGMSVQLGPVFLGHLGPSAPPGEIHSTVVASAISAGATDGSSIYFFGYDVRDRFFTGITSHLTAEQLATVHATHRGDPDRFYLKRVFGFFEDEFSALMSVGVTVQQGVIARTEHYFGDGFIWFPMLQQVREVDGFLEPDTDTGHTAVRHRAGTTAVEHWGHAPFGPSFAKDFDSGSAARLGDQLRLRPSMFSEAVAPARVGRWLGSYRFALVRNGEVMFEHFDEAAFGELDDFEVPPERATYRFEIDAAPALEVSALSTRVSAAWTFASEHVAGEEPLVLPLPALRFRPALDEQNRAPRVLPLVLPVAIERPDGAVTRAIARVDVEASFDDGATWSTVFGVRIGDRWFGVVVHPQHASHVSLRGSARDIDGNRVDQTIIRAYALAP